LITLHKTAPNYSSLKFCRSDFWGNARLIII
jgi:hypothetical protein